MAWLSQPRDVKWNSRASRQVKGLEGVSCPVGVHADPNRVRQGVNCGGGCDSGTRQVPQTVSEPRPPREGRTRGVGDGR